LIEENTLIIKTKYDFYKDKITETTNRLTIEEAIDKITGVNLKIKRSPKRNSKPNILISKRKKASYRKPWIYSVEKL